MAELADALDLGSSGRPWGFKSLCSHQEIKREHDKCSLFICVAIATRLKPRFNPLAGDGNPFVANSDISPKRGIPLCSHQNKTPKTSWVFFAFKTIIGCLQIKEDIGLSENYYYLSSLLERHHM